MNRIYLIEEPHLVIQGEGNFVGTKMLLLRFAKCNIFCKGCDTPYSWNTKNSISYSIEELRDIIVNNLTKVRNILITGGEPGLQKDNILKLMKLINPYHYVEWHIETAGHINWDILRIHSTRIQYNISPKIGSLKPAKDWEWAALEKPLPLKYIVKIVVSPENWEKDLDAIIELQLKYNIPDENIYLMPLGTNREEIIENSIFCIDKAFETGYNFSSRQHILLYDNKRLV